jgi:hypothetical protein
MAINEPNHIGAADVGHRCCRWKYSAGSKNLSY